MAEAERPIGMLGLKAINLEPGFGSPPRAFDDALLWPLCEALQDWETPVFLMSGPTTPDVAFNSPDPSAVSLGVFESANRRPSRRVAARR